MSIDPILEKVVALVRQHQARRPIRTHLDVGSGRGDLIGKFRSQFPEITSSACDYTDELMRLQGVKVDIVDLNVSGLPYADASFDLVTATEVIEHLEDFRRLVKEIQRVLKPGGVCILSTPNILNINSRLRFLWFGFWNLFGPLPVKHGELYSTGGHINPCSWFFVAHALLNSDFTEIRPHIDKVQRSSVWKFVLLWPFIRVFGWRAMQLERNKYHTISPENEPIVVAMNSTPMLLGRTVLADAVKPA